MNNHECEYCGEVIRGDDNKCKSCQKVFENTLVYKVNLLSSETEKLFKIISSEMKESFKTIFSKTKELFKTILSIIGK